MSKRENLKSRNEIIFLDHNDKVRFRKKLLHSLEQLLDTISDDAFYQFVTPSQLFAILVFMIVFIATTT